MWTNLILGELQIYLLVLLSIGADIYLKKYIILDTVIWTPLFYSNITICFPLPLGLSSKNKCQLPDKYMETPINFRKFRFILSIICDPMECAIELYLFSQVFSNLMNLLPPPKWIAQLSASKSLLFPSPELFSLLHLAFFS